MNDEDMYDPYRTDFKYLRIVVKMILVLIVIITLLLIIRCEPTDYSNPECCWKCTIMTTYFYPGENPYEVVGIGRFEYCDKTDEEISKFENDYTYDGITNDSIKFEQIAKCRK